MTQGLTANTISKPRPQCADAVLVRLLRFAEVSGSVERHVLTSAYQRLAVNFRSDRRAAAQLSSGHRSYLRCPVLKRSQYRKQTSVYRSRARSAVVSLTLCLVFGTTIPNAAAQTIPV